MKKPVGVSILAANIDLTLEKRSAEPTVASTVMPDDDDNDPNWASIYEEFASGIRPHASYWALSKDRVANELSVLREYETALAKDGRLFFRNPRHSGEGSDPPDCEADDLDGGTVAIELTELVDGDAIVLARRGETAPRNYWPREHLVSLIEATIRKKDRPSDVKGGPYSAYLLVIYTDEWVGLDLLAGHIFPRTTLISRVFVLMSYMPASQGCPCIELQIARTEWLGAARGSTDGAT